MERFDVIVVGGGVAGASCIFHLAARGITRTLLLERTSLCAGSSGRSAAFIETLYTDEDRVRWTQATARLLTGVRKRLARFPERTRARDGRAYLHVGDYDAWRSRRLREPLLKPSETEREGYVPNVVYSCGALIHNRELILPYAMSDYATNFATVSLDEILGAME